MNTVIRTLVVGGLAAGVGLGWLYAGRVDVSADTPHSPALLHFIAWVRDNAVARSSAVIVPPEDLADAERIRRSAGNYDAMCADCHLAPGVEESEIHRGLYPPPPNLARADDRGAPAERAAARRFWIIKHGIKGSGMPAWTARSSLATRRRTASIATATSRMRTPTDIEPPVDAAPCSRLGTAMLAHRRAKIPRRDYKNVRLRTVC